MAVMPHILLDEKMTAPYALLPGDPARLDRIAAHLDQVEELAYNREFRSLRGFYKGVRVMALSDLVDQVRQLQSKNWQNSESVI